MGRIAILRWSAGQGRRISKTGSASWPIQGQRGLGLCEPPTRRFTRDFRQTVLSANKPIQWLMALVLSTAPCVIATADAEVRSYSILYEVTGMSPGTPFSKPLGIYFDPIQRECYVADTGNHQVVVCDEFGMPLFHFFRQVTRNGTTIPGEPRSLVVDEDGRIFLVDNLIPQIEVLDPRGRKIAQIDPPDDGCGREHRFEYVARGPDDLILAVVGCKRRRVAIIDGTLSLYRIIDLRSPHKESMCITGLSVDGGGQIFITDPCGEEMVQIFDDDGEYVKGFGRHDAGFENFSHPSGIVVMPNGDIWIVDTIRQVASRFTISGDFIDYVGGKGEGLGSFAYPSAVTTDGTSKLFVLERGGNRYQCFEFDDEEPEMNFSRD